eukprot:1330713-Amorphochlora_amoeboformis.AAC.1
MAWLAVIPQIDSYIHTCTHGVAHHNTVAVIPRIDLDIHTCILTFHTSNRSRHPYMHSLRFGLLALGESLGHPKTQVLLALSVRWPSNLPALRSRPSATPKHEL